MKFTTNKQYSQDNIFHTILGIMSIKTKIYNKKQDILSE